MKHSILFAWASVIAIAAIVSYRPPAVAQSAATNHAMPVTPTGCTPRERMTVLRELQQHVLATVPRRVNSLDQAIQPGGPLAGWRLSHGHAVLASAGAVGIDNVKTQYPTPQLLLYAPSRATSPENWRDFDGPDGPYTLVGWAYIAPYQEGSEAPQRRCIAEHEWLVHEAGWHTKDGGMVLTPAATSEPTPTPSNVAKYFWHPRAWDIHFWLGESGVPVIADENPRAPRGGVDLPKQAFFHVVDGQKYP
jgi:hypothetical protein